jgi:hypothetical protein
MKEPTFDIFKGTSDKDAIWVEAVQGLAKACQRMEEIAENFPGEYFVFSQQSHSILARVNTRKAPPLSAEEIDEKRA